MLKGSSYLERLVLLLRSLRAGNKMLVESLEDENKVIIGQLYRSY